jgi:GNAT superfamily N-acetyltransferase
MAYVLIRWAEPGDRHAWRGLWQGFLDYYSVPLPEDVTDYTWARLMDPASTLKARLAFVDGQAVGFAIHQHHPSTWVMGDDCYLEDLFVDPQARGRGVARALIEDLITVARGKGWKRLYWNTDHDNHVARALYDQFTKDDGHVRYRLTL